MLKKAKAAAASGEDTRDEQGKALADSVLESSRQIWLAGLGAFARAQAEGATVFESLVQQGQALESRTKQAAADTAAAARDVAQSKAREMQAKAGGTWDKLEQVFEDRVARALSRLGVHTQSDVERLTERVDALSEAVNELIKATGVTPKSRASSPVKRMVKGAVRTAAQTASTAARTAGGAVSTAGKTARKTVRTAQKVAKAVGARAPLRR
jgi:poly(hydroxyalkanoate) granule-associated protein